MNPRNYEDLESLKHEHHLPMSDLIVLSSQSDPFYRGSADSKRRAEWFLELFDSHKAAGYPGSHIRALHYSALSQGKLIPDGSRKYGEDGNVYNDWQWLNGSAAHARYAGLVDPADIVDRRSKESFWVPGRDAGWSRDDSSVSLPELESSQPEIASDLGFFLHYPTEPTVHGYGYGREDQPVVLSIWVEKSGPEDVLLPVCEEFGISLVVGTGYQSITRIVGFLRQMAEDGRPVRIGYISDYDAAGENMPVQVARQIEFWIMDQQLEIDVALQPLLLNSQQVAPGGLTPDGLPLAPSSDPKRQVVELDAVPIYAPGAMEAIVTEFVNLYRDDELEEEMQRAERQAFEIASFGFESVSTAFNNSCDELEEEAASLLEAYNDQLQELNEMLQIDLVFVKERTALLKEVSDVRAKWWSEMIRESLPIVPGPNWETPDEDEYLFSSERDYMEQLAAYRRHKGQCELGTDRMKTCGWWDCGIEFQAKHMKSKFHHDSCRKAYNRWSRKWDRDFKSGKYQQEEGSA